MIISSNKMQTLKAAPNSAYEVILPEYLYQSNKIEGSTFTLNQIDTFYATNRVTGDHDFDDIIETKNSFKMFDRMVDTLGVELTPELLIEFETILHKGTAMAANGKAGISNTFPTVSETVRYRLPSRVTYRPPYRSCSPNGTPARRTSSRFLVSTQGSNICIRSRMATGESAASL